MRHVFLFLACFVAGAVAALAIRTARHQPHPVLPPPAATAALVTAPTPGAANATAGPGTPVNTTCAICGMPVDPNLPTATYQGKTIGFGCRMCPPKFQADPERYGPAFLGAARPSP
jgi:YHS domain-containing protein